MNRIRYIGLAVFLMYMVAWADAEKQTVESNDTESALWFPIGEELHYRVYWGRIPVGRTVATTQWDEDEETGKRLLLIRFRTQSNSFIEKIYPVDDTIESWIDPETFLPVRNSIRLSQGRYRKHEVTEFDRENGKARWKSLIKDKKSGEVDIKKDTRDLISFAYFMRKEGYKPGTRTQYQVYTDEKIYDLWMKAGKRERIKLKQYGKVPSIRLDPEAAFQGFFVRKGKVTFWVSDDKRRVMTRMEGSVPLASVKLVLQRVKGPGNDDWILDGDDEEDEDDEE